MRPWSVGVDTSLTEFLADHARQKPSHGMRLPLCPSASADREAPDGDRSIARMRSRLEEEGASDAVAVDAFERRAFGARR